MTTETTTTTTTTAPKMTQADFVARSRARYTTVEGARQSLEGARREDRWDQVYYHLMVARDPRGRFGLEKTDVNPDVVAFYEEYQQGLREEALTFQEAVEEAWGRGASNAYIIAQELDIPMYFFRILPRR